MLAPSQFTFSFALVIAKCGVITIHHLHFINSGTIIKVDKRVALFFFFLCSGSHVKLLFSATCLFLLVLKWEILSKYIFYRTFLIQIWFSFISSIKKNGYGVFQMCVIISVKQLTVATLRSLCKIFTELTLFTVSCQEKMIIPDSRCYYWAECCILQGGSHSWKTVVITQLSGIS